MARFDFKQFSVDDGDCAMKVGTDSVLLGAWTDLTDVNSVIDLGAGSALLSLMIAQRCAAPITAIEIDSRACACAAANCAASPWASQIEIQCADAFDYSPDAPVDLIVSNPPYFAHSLKSPDAGRTNARHASDDGLGPLTCILLASNWLSPTGSIAMVTPVDYDDAVTFATEMARLKVWRKCLVSTNAAKAPSRILWQISRDYSKRYTPGSLSLRNAADNSYTTEYITLTQDYYLHL